MYGRILYIGKNTTRVEEKLFYAINERLSIFPNFLDTLLKREQVEKYIDLQNMETNIFISRLFILFILIFCRLLEDYFNENAPPALAQ